MTYGELPHGLWDGPRMLFRVSGENESTGAGDADAVRIDYEDIHRTPIGDIAQFQRGATVDVGPLRIVVRDFRFDLLTQRIVVTAFDLVDVDHSRTARFALVDTPPAPP